MQASELNRAVAQATGESISTIQRMGFILAEEHSEESDGEVSFGPNVVDWDEVEFVRMQLQQELGRNVPSAA
ncbi:hypothetical protein [Bremerella alba]|uniref:Uncharacterized protein n=1 Tax=Bremerella alba TaxID=980252 RepID=A0A7V8V7I1_9BACT|nr:hypothetical protein [Bremerella alba]MBA2116111.1 hypothetical protein [Bremerella alba]